MKQFKHVFEFEFMSLLKKRTVRVTTIILCLIVIVATSVPTIAKMFRSGNDTSGQSTTTEITVSEERDIGVLKDNFSDLAALVFAGESVHDYQDREALSEAVNAGEVAFGIIFTSDVSFELLVKDSSLDNYDLQIVASILQTIKVNNNLIELGIDPLQVMEAQMVSIEAEMTVLGRNSLEGYFIGFGIVFIIYMMIILYGQMVATSVAREKDSRTMELLITSTKPSTLILGKVLANSLFGCLQIALLIAVGIVSFSINRVNYPPEILMFIQGSMDVNTAVIYILFSVTGYVMYLFLYAAFGSLVSRLEDVGNAISPIMVIFVAAYMIASFSMNMPNSTLSIVSSYIPFTALFIMPIRNMLTTVGFMEIAISLGLMILTTYLMIVVSVYIYRMGSLNYGNKVKMGTLIKGIFNKK